jgi:xanthine dehydrogenase YagS FAD-binding subunit
LNRIEALENGGLRLGALVTNTDAADHEQVERRYPLFAKAILAGASPQLRNMATMGGNLMQRTRCYYFYDTVTPCNKREPGTGCAAIDGLNRIHAILGTSDHCIATHPSNMCVALAALEAIVQVIGKEGKRTIPFADVHRLPGDTPEMDTDVRADELIVSVDLPAKGFPKHYTHLKIRDRASYAVALVPVAAALDMDGEHIKEARLALGGIAPKPWRDTHAEAMLAGQRATTENFQKVAEFIMRDAKGFTYNAFKIALAKRAVVRALRQAAAMERT